MAVIWGLPNWVWYVLAGFALAGFLIIARVLVMLFAAFRELFESLELSQRMLTAALESTRSEMEKMQESMARIGNKSVEGGDPAWKDW
ncbi:MAG TPA: hypothetical protein VM841_13150 [Actinomycetota bacterium]|nr:hypothetical protein [Actinomycetota bacterium]